MARPAPPPSRPRVGRPSVLDHRPARTIEDQIRHSFFCPSPQDYVPVGHEFYAEPKKGGVISDARIPSVHDHVPNSKAFVPGPGTYATGHGEFALPEGGKLNRKPPQSRLKLDEYPKPAPGQYGIPNDDLQRPRQLYGAFGKDPRVSKFIQDEVVRTRNNPGPGAHEVQEAMENVQGFCPEGGRLLSTDARSSGYFDHAARLKADLPPPGAYDIPDRPIQSKGHSACVFRYESATIKETKAIINRECGEANAAPGPGTYDQPDPPPINPTPTIKGRQLGHGMPFPYAYNCAPDMSMKYTEPVRQRNSADQIYGTGVRRGSNAGASQRSGQGRRDHQENDQVHSAMLPATVGVVDPPGEDAVRWRSGGFSVLKKSASAGDVRMKGKHPSIKEAEKFYPKLCRRRGRDSKTFMPMATRKSENIPTHDTSEEYQRLCRSQWQLGALTEGIAQAADAALEPLDLEKLRMNAIASLADKAKERMLLEGLPQAKRDLVLSEMMNVLQEKHDEHQLAQQIESDDFAGDVGETHEGDSRAASRATWPEFESRRGSDADLEDVSRKASRFSQVDRAASMQSNVPRAESKLSESRPRT